ncbi:hypothetical protein EYZ11_003805 [Aspergillus tanneri]|uniref:Zn(2)-C6 fungal-type domain-containing protein n=1 Tax=Aspergillus tanneri TaxID=1220188 RepID=A0A4S3JM43_9EURO|nr:uncharacterized protein ATNIH1004_003528 [Aspergillus tanneri]KAA8650839.1 hypothetical protein ATNIH1004_003528 [Aspergillus tanneri]THC96699.1 hypothetical protein EYZ11_003805 [Aspergillus tanneri]
MAQHYISQPLAIVESPQINITSTDIPEIPDILCIVVYRLIQAKIPSTFNGIMGTEKQNPEPSDLACTRCRERKIRCGRERPHCRSCEREDVPCVYQNPVKRVNHLKLLCDSVDRLQDRLTSIESHLSRLHNPEVSVSARQSPRVDMGSETIPESRWKSLPSLPSLCRGFQGRVREAGRTTAAIDSSLESVCVHASTTEPFPPYSDVTVPLLPKPQVSAAIEHFLHNVDVQTDVFEQEHLRAQLDRVYKQPDDAWAICFKTITLLVLGLEIARAGVLFGDFARSMLPSRASLVSSRLLTKERLVNVQTLILLSVAAQQLDPPDWTELIFANACLLARSMRLHGTLDENSHETTKVLQALYARDRSLCIARGSLCWLPREDFNLTGQMAAMSRESLYAQQLRLAVIQDEIYRVAHTSSSMQPVETQLDQYAVESGVLCGPTPTIVCRVVSVLEFLSARILTFCSQSQSPQAHMDARTSCLLLLIAYGDQSREVQDALRAILPGTETSGPEPPCSPFFTPLDTFSLPGLFLLLEDQLVTQDTTTQSLSNRDLLGRVSTCYTEQTSRLPPSHHHRRVSSILTQLLHVIDKIRTSRETSSAPINQSSGESIDSELPEIWPPPPPPSSASLTWDSWLSVSSPLGAPSLGPPTPLPSMRVASPDLLTQMLISSQGLEDTDALSWSILEEPGRKRRREDGGM